jgi:hypothetical protein
MRIGNITWKTICASRPRRVYKHHAYLSLHYALPHELDSCPKKKRSTRVWSSSVLWSSKNAMHTSYDLVRVCVREVRNCKLDELGAGRDSGGDEHRHGY